MKLNLILGIIVLFLVSCQSGDDSTTNKSGETDLKLITGMEARASEFGSSILLGNPNVFSSHILMYPNPAIGFLNIKGSVDTVITDVWLVEGNPQKTFQSVDFSKVLNSNLYKETELLSNSTLNFSELSGSNINLNLENVSFGYYKIFIKANDEILWGNIYIGNDIDIDDLISFWN
ncbi:hypothetical protein MBM09_10450 [Flaviramulus sp. BrNp1-15]|uniref:hypothetical protein n=1 Tax=Flaviramulus sp. BrNp1-15 TaxID=2916754 RepID=UPI001EE95238|nr:hypothetical protein [Flaviramulus sp. BrNp1-15]ULC58341.1 hypothetical protein MBM09_10450 [Flaviramulus sp. BrNp1-15]